MLSQAYSISPRKTKKSGVVYDVRFRIPDSDGIERPKKLCGYQTKADAKMAHKQFMDDYEAKRPIVEPDGTPLFDDAVVAHLEYEKSQLKDSTYYEKEKIFVLYISSCFAGRRLSEIDKKALMAWQDNMWTMKNPANGKYYSQKYLARVRGLFSKFLTFCYERYDTPNYLKKITMPVRKSVKRTMVIYELDEFNTFIDAVDNCLWKTVFMTLFYSGLRLGELIALETSDYLGNALNIDKSATSKTTGGESYKISETKNYRNRITPIPKILQAQIDEYMEWRKANGINGRWLFEVSTLLKKGDRPLAPQTIRNNYEHYLSLTTAKKIRIHDFRHSYVSMCAHLGATALMIAGLIGDTPEQVMRTYAHLWESDKRVIINKIDDLLVKSAINVP